MLRAYAQFITRHAAWVVLAAFVLLAGAIAFEYYRRNFRRCWDEIQVEIEDWIRDNPT